MKEPLNIISESYNLDIVGGPEKVIVNTIKGLIKIGYPFEINRDIRHYRYNWIHDSRKGLIEVGLCGIPAVLGPNIAVLPKDLPRFRPLLANCIYLHPSQWCVDLWNEICYSECLLQPWPAGIDTEDFNIKRNITGSSEVMIYFKRRDPGLLDQAITMVRSMGLNPLIIRYGEYDDGQYKQILSRCKFGIWIGISESQGIALQEALASGLPLIVCNVNSLFESTGENDYSFPDKLRNFKPTSAPYFDEQCGIIINDFSKLKESINEILINISNYKPREFIIENLSLEKQAKELLSFFDIIDQKSPNILTTSIIGKGTGIFTPSYNGRIIYLIFIISRKTKTMFGMIKKAFRKLSSLKQ